MKHPFIKIFWLLFIGSLFLQCSDQQSPTSISDESNTSLDKVTIEEYTFDYDLGTEPPYTDCVTGASMQNHGVVLIYAREITTPSGNWITEGHVDYDAYGGVTLENTSTNEVWTCQNGENPWNEIENHNGSYRLHYHWNEVYKLGNQILNLHLQGFFTIDQSGNITKDLQTYSCN